MLIIIDLDEIDRCAHLTEIAGLQRTGLDEWIRAENLFSDLVRRNQLILNAAGWGIYGLNAEGRTTFVNRADQEMLGWTTKYLLGKAIYSIIHHHDCPIYKSFGFEQLKHIEDEVFWRKDRKPGRVGYILAPIYDHQILAGAVVIFRSITERKKNEPQLRHALQ